MQEKRILSVICIMYAKHDEIDFTGRNTTYFYRKYGKIHYY